MQQLSQNRFFRHKYFKSIVIKSTMRKSDYSDNNFYHLYIDLIEGDRIVGMDGNKSFMLATARHQDNWTQMLEEWATLNQYEDYNPHRMSQEEATEFILDCRKELPQGSRLGQSIINNLDDETPTPNIEIFNSTDESHVLDWFYTHCTK
jgi:hypothetical protein